MASQTRQESEHGLVERAAGGEREAFEVLYRRHADAAWRAAQAIVSNPDDATDAVADAFTRIFQALRSGRTTQIEHFRAYLLTVTRHAAIDRCRLRDRGLDTARRLSSEGSSAEHTPVDAVVDLTNGEFVTRAFQDLPDRWRRVLWLTEVEGRSSGDVADALGIQPNAAYQLVHRARAGLRERFLRKHLPTVTDAECSATVEQLARFVLGTLSDARRHQVVEHLDRCEACRSRHEDLEGIAPRPLAALHIGGGLVSLAHSAASGVGSGFTAATDWLTSDLGRAAAVGAAVVGLALGGSGTGDVATATDHLDTPPGTTSEAGAAVAGVETERDEPGPSGGSSHEEPTRTSGWVHDHSTRWAEDRHPSSSASRTSEQPAPREAGPGAADGKPAAQASDRAHDTAPSGEAGNAGNAGGSTAADRGRGGDGAPGGGSGRSDAPGRSGTSQAEGERRGSPPAQDAGQRGSESPGRSDGSGPPPRAGAGSPRR